MPTLNNSSLLPTTSQSDIQSSSTTSSTTTTTSRSRILNDSSNVMMLPRRPTENTSPSSLNNNIAQPPLYNSNNNNYNTNSATITTTYTNLMNQQTPSPPSNNVNTIPNIQSKIIALSNGNNGHNWDSSTTTPKENPSSSSSPRKNNALIVISDTEGKRLVNMNSYPIPQLSHKSLKAVKNLTDRYAPNGVNTKKSLRKTSKKFLIKIVEIERKKRQLNSENPSNQHESNPILSDIEKKSRENTLLCKATRDLEEKIESVSQNLTFLEKQSQRDKHLIQFYRNRERISTNNTKVQNPLLATASNFIGTPRQPLSSMQQAVVTLFESQGLPSDPFDLSTMTPPKGTSLKSIVYYWKVFCKISYVCRFILTKENYSITNNNTNNNNLDQYSI